MSNFAWQYFALTITSPYHFQWTWPYFKIAAMSVNNWNFCLIIHLLKLCRIIKLSLVDKEYTFIFHFCSYSRVIIDVLSDLTKTLTFASLQTLFNWGLSNFVWLYPCWGSRNLYQVWWPWPYFTVTDMSEL